MEGAILSSSPLPLHSRSASTLHPNSTAAYLAADPSVDGAPGKTLGTHRPKDLVLDRWWNTLIQIWVRSCRRLRSRPSLWGSGAIDFAGSGPVHMMGGVTALVAAIVLGPRLGRFTDRETGEPLEEPVSIPGHSTPLAILGTFALWFGWYVFNPCSTFGASSQTKGTVAALVAQVDRSQFVKEERRKANKR